MPPNPLKEWRHARQLGIREAARRADLNPSQVIDYEAGMRPGLASIERMHRATGGEIAAHRWLEDDCRPEEMMGTKIDWDKDKMRRVAKESEREATTATNRLMRSAPKAPSSPWDPEPIRRNASKTKGRK